MKILLLLEDSIDEETAIEMVLNFNEQPWCREAELILGCENCKEACERIE